MAGILWNSVGAEFYEGERQLAGVHAPSTVGELEAIVPRATAEKTTWALSASTLTTVIRPSSNRRGNVDVHDHRIRLPLRGGVEVPLRELLGQTEHRVG